MAGQTLKFRVSLYLALCLTAALALFTTLIVNHERDELLAAAVDQLNQLSEVIIRSTRFAMLENRRELRPQDHRGRRGRQEHQPYQDHQQGRHHHRFHALQ